MAKSNDFIVAVDIGTSSIKTLVANINESESKNKFRFESLKVIAFSSIPFSGVQKGMIVNIEETISAIKKSIFECENMAGIKLTKAVVNISANYSSCLNSSGVVGVKTKEISKGDIERVLTAAKAVAISADQHPLHLIPQEYKVDEHDQIKDPLGMMGVRLEAKVHMITASKSVIQNVISCCNKSKLLVKDLCLSPVAVSESVLSQDEKDLGVAVVDIGAGTSDIAVFYRGSIVYTSSIEFGGNSITQDLSIGLRTPVAEAEKIKLEYGSATLDKETSNNKVLASSVGGRPPHEVDLHLIHEIIECRAEEILNLIRKQVVNSGCGDIIAGGVVLTGGCTQLKNFNVLANKVFNIPVKVAYPTTLVGIDEQWFNPELSTVVGMIIWDAKRKFKNNSRNLSRFKNIVHSGHKIKSWIEELL